MVTTAIPYEKVKEDALHLPIEDRSRLASCILKSLDEDDFQLSPEWAEELDHRSKAIDDGTEEMMSVEDFWKEVNQRFGTNFQ